MNFIYLQIRQLCKRIHEYSLKLSKMYANKRYLSESSSEDVDDPDGVSDSNENDHLKNSEQYSVIGLFSFFGQFSRKLATTLT